MTTKVRQCRKKMAGTAAANTTYAMGGLNGNVDSLVGERILRIDVPFCEATRITTDEASSRVLSWGAESSVGLERRVMDSQPGVLQTDLGN